MTVETFIKAQLAAFAFSEAYASGGREPMLAVACIIRNRVRRGWNNGDWMATLNAASEVAPFEPVEPWWDVVSANFRYVLGEIDDIYTGMFDDILTGREPADPTRSVGGLYYLDTALLQSGRVMRPWFEQRILRDQANHPRVAQVGNLHIFA